MSTYCQVEGQDEILTERPSVKYLQEVLKDTGQDTIRLFYQEMGSRKYSGYVVFDKDLKVIERRRLQDWMLENRKIDTSICDSVESSLCDFLECDNCIFNDRTERTKEELNAKFSNFKI